MSLQRLAELGEEHPDTLLYPIQFTSLLGSQFITTPWIQTFLARLSEQVRADYCFPSLPTPPALLHASPIRSGCLAINPHVLMTWQTQLACAH